MKVHPLISDIIIALSLNNGCHHKSVMPAMVDMPGNKGTEATSLRERGRLSYVVRRSNDAKHLLRALWSSGAHIATRLPFSHSPNLFVPLLRQRSNAPDVPDLLLGETVRAEDVGRLRKHDLVGRALVMKKPERL